MNKHVDKLLEDLRLGNITPTCVYLQGLEDAARACEEITDEVVLPGVAADMIREMKVGL